MLDTIVSSHPHASKQTKRVKRVVTSGEVPHLWFHQTQSDARTSNGSLYFEGSTIFSYGSHFPIARHVRVGKRSAVLFTTKTYSVTTSGHCSAVRSAIPETATVFELQDIAQLNHSANFKDYVSRIEIAVSKSARARSSWAKQSQHEEATKLVSQSRAYGKFFNVKVPKLPSVPALDSEEMQKVRDREARVASAKAEQTRKENSERIERWRNGENVGYLYNLPVMLRIVGEEIETSRGARVPVSHALRGLRFVREVVKRGEAYQRNGHTLHLGNYAIDRIETDGTLKAGCHVIPYAEIERIAPALETAVQS